jgi:hypothetical protein
MEGKMLLFGIGRRGFVHCELDGFDGVVSVPPGPVSLVRFGAAVAKRDDNTGLMAQDTPFH